MSRWCDWNRRRHVPIHRPGNRKNEERPGSPDRSPTVSYRPLPSVCIRFHTHPIPLLVLVLELHDAVDEREQRVVAAAADVLAGMEFRAALPHEDVTGPHRLAAEALHAEVLRT